MYAVVPALKGEMAGRTTEIRLRGAGGEPVDFRRTIASHGVADLPPNRIDEQAWTLELTLAPGGSPATTVLVSEGRKGHAKVKVLAGRAKMADLRPAVAHVLRLDEDLRPFYEAAASDPDLRVGGAGRRPDDPEPDRVRGGREDDLHDELHLVGDRAHGLEPRPEPR